MACLSGQTAHRLADVADPYCPGMEAFAIDPDELATALQRRFQSSASVTKLPGKTETGAQCSNAALLYTCGTSSCGI